MTKITLETEDGVYTVQTKLEIDKLPDIYELLVEPLFLAAGFQENTIAGCLPDEEQCEPVPMLGKANEIYTESIRAHERARCVEDIQQRIDGVIGDAYNELYINGLKNALNVIENRD